MKIVVRFPVPSWYTDFSYHLAEWIYEDEWETGRKPNWLRRQRLALELLWFRTTCNLWCDLFGCDDLVDYDPGDPEVGPNPKIYCLHCGRRQ